MSTAIYIFLFLIFCVFMLWLNRKTRPIVEQVELEVNEKIDKTIENIQNKVDDRMTGVK